MIALMSQTKLPDSSNQVSDIVGAVHIDQTIPASVQAQSDKERIKELERENKELKQANEIIRKAAGLEAQAEKGR